METLKQLHDLAPDVLNFIEALVVLCTALQAVFLGLGKIWPAFGTAAHWLGIAALDMKQATDGIRKAADKVGSAGKTGTVAVVLIVCLPFIGGCRSFLHFSDPSADDFVERMCIGKADEHRAEIEAEAQRTGAALETLLLAFQTACLFRAKAGFADGERAGMAGVMGHAPLTPENAAPDLKDPELEGRK